MSRRLILPVLAVLTLTAFAQSSRTGGFPPPVFPGTTTPYNDAWRQTQRDTQVEYTIAKQAMIAFPSETHPDVYARFNEIAGQLEWFHRVSFGTEIKTLPTLPAALAPSPE